MTRVSILWREKAFRVAPLSTLSNILLGEKYSSAQVRLEEEYVSSSCARKNMCLVDVAPERALRITERS